MAGLSTTAHLIHHLGRYLGCRPSRLATIYAHDPFGTAWSSCSRPNRRILCENRGSPVGRCRIGPIVTSNKEGNYERLPGDRRRRHEHISCVEAAADAIKTAGQSVRDLRVAEVAKQGIDFGTVAISSTARRSSCPSSTSTNRRARQARLIAWAPSVGIIANTEADRVCVVAQG
jgi:hypothetical protein